MAKLKKKVKRNLFIILLLILILVGFSFSYQRLNNYFRSKNDTNNIKEDEPKENPEEEIKTYKASLIATGDGLIHSNVYNAAYNSETKTYDFSSMLTYTKEKIKDYDLKYYNQETVFDDSSSLSNYPRFNTPSAFGQNMMDAGFNLVSLATNHSMDMSATGAYNSSSWWEKQENILATGMFTSEEKRNNYPIKEINGITYSMLSYTYGTNGIPIPNDKNYLINLFSEEQAKKDIEAIRDKVDVLIVAMHWGTEYKLDATETQRNQAKFLADLGVDIILGTHSHCVEPWEWLDDTVVFYSFGNFISGQNHKDNTDYVRKITSIGMFATLDITKTVDSKTKETTIKIDNIGADLTYNYKFYNQEKKKNDYVVIPFSQMKQEYYEFGNLEDAYEEFSAVLKKYDSNINIEPLPQN